jgi:hypothetical protein
MSHSNLFVSPNYPVLYAVAPPDVSAGGPAHLSLALLVGGVPSFLATLPVDPELLDGLTESLDSGDVRVSVRGIAVGADEVEAAEGTAPGVDEPDEAWRASAPAWDEGMPRPDAGAGSGAPRDDGATGGDNLPAAYLGLVCRDGRRMGVARIVSRDRRATPDDVARYVLEKISSGVQIPDLASAG